MSILIKGMEMPKSCIWRDGKCPLLGDDDNCKLQDCQEDWTWEDQYKGCPLSEAPEPCEDAVSREAVSEWLKQYGQDVLHRKYKFSLMYIWKNLMDLPSAQPERETGKWVYGSPVTVKCNQCGFYIPDWEAHSSRFCRNCGCRMLKEGEQE